MRASRPAQTVCFFALLLLLFRGSLITATVVQKHHPMRAIAPL
jgi:hypothetical protein